jgi:hypothetical protein
MERQSKESRNLEAHRKGGQGLPRAVAPSKKKNITDTVLDIPCAFLSAFLAYVYLPTMLREREIIS